MRNNKDYVFISCGPNGQNDRGVHAHNDKLSFELCVNGEDVIIDPGTYVYTPNQKWRNTFRSTGYHNTVKVDDHEQNQIIVSTSEDPKRLNELIEGLRSNFLEFGEKVIAPMT